MPQVEFSERQVTFKIVYYGPPLSGKTTNLARLHERVDELNRGRLMTLDTRDDRTLFFDLLPVFFKAANVAYRVKVYTVPGQPMHEATRRVVLRGVDGVVFVADAQAGEQAANRTAYLNLCENLERQGATHVPILIQYNKTDLPSAIPTDDRVLFGPRDVASVSASAITGVGVVDSFVAAALASWDAAASALRLGDHFGIDREAFEGTLRVHLGAATGG